MMKVSDYIAEFLERKGIDHVFELSGGMITHLLDSIHQKTSIKIVSMHHEQSAAFAADAYGRITGKPGVALATSGPGATNLLTGIGSCYFDSSPAIFITGQVNRHEQKGARDIRQLGFQETDIVSIASHLTKKSFKIERPEDIPDVFEEAFEIATTGRPGPVLIDIPMDVQRSNIEIEISPVKKSKETVFAEDLSELVAALKECERPLLLIGRGVKAAFAGIAMEIFLELTKIPAVTSLLAIDALVYKNPQRVGFIGSYGNRWANIALGECDMLIVEGSRLDIRQTGADTKFFEQRKIFHIDCEAAEINNRIKGCTPVVSDVKLFFEHFNKTYKEVVFHKKENWLQYIQLLNNKWPDTTELDVKGINPNVFVHVVTANSPDAIVYLADVGSHQMWVAQSIEIANGQVFLTSGGMGAMGFALPAAIGASMAMKNKPVVAFIGDGCMQLNIQELQTIVRNKIPVKIIVLNNKNLGMIRQFQQSYFDSRFQSTCWGYSAPDFEKIATAYNIDALTIDQPDEMAEAVQWLWTEENKNKPQLLQVMIDPMTNTYPKIAFGKPITEMEPFASPIDMEGT